ncbi:MAG: hypothetical protein ACQESG_06520 [Nanobdellota archaeon]
MEKERTLTDIVTTAVVGLTTFVGGVEITKGAMDLGDKMAPHIEKYTGWVGSSAVEYGLPVDAGAGMLVVLYTAIKATDNYLSGKGNF